ncbi:hypothetical protein TNCT_637991 [Trichonephila clavata]|uniref:Uncharacterized protein n=1 Tax=Trichonephila clavata TaxID=2740835 RepID=A0A8X6J0B8_TRICU|nr:hypothetical protein TNCT_637991 [Trichonephila clavata]
MEAKDPAKLVCDVDKKKLQNEALVLKNQQKHLVTSRANFQNKPRNGTSYKKHSLMSTQLVTIIVERVLERIRRKIVKKLPLFKEARSRRIEISSSDL